MVRMDSSAPLSRNVSPLERLFWHADRNRPNHFSIAAEVEGTVSAEEWQSALDVVAARSPVVQSYISEQDDGRPIFRPVEHYGVPLTLHPRPDQDWTGVVSRELGRPFEAEETSLLRAAVHTDGETTTVVLTAHHAVADGKSLVAFLRDVLITLAGGSAPRCDIRDSVEALASASNGELPFVEAGALPPPLPYRIDPAGRPICHSTVLSEELTRDLRMRSRDEGTTVHAVLAAALARSFYNESAGAGMDVVRMLSPIDVRSKLLGGSKHLGLCIVAALTALPSPTADLWDDARAIANDLAPSKTIPSLLSVLGLVQSLDGQISSDEFAAALFSTAFGCNLLLTNLGEVALPSVYGRLTLTSLWGPAVMTGIEGQQTIGVTTFNGRIHLMHTSHTPIPDLLDSTRSIVSAACESAPKAGPR